MALVSRRLIGGAEAEMEGRRVQLPLACACLALHALVVRQSPAEHLEPSCCRPI